MEILKKKKFNSSTPHPEKASLWLHSLSSIHNGLNGIVLYHKSLHLLHVKQKLSAGPQQTFEVFHEAAIKVAQIT